MKRPNIFWGLVFVVIGGLLLLGNFGLFRFNWNILWPSLVILLGAWILWQSQLDGGELESETASCALEGATEAHLTLRHGAGELRVNGGASNDELFSGTFHGGLTQEVQRSGAHLDATLKVPHQGMPYVVMPWLWGQGNRIRWDIAINEQIPVRVALHSGANDARLDLSRTQVAGLELHTGASATEIVLPEKVALTQVKIEAGAASVKLLIPPGVAARMEVDGGLLDVDVDTERFPKSGKIYQSPEYETAPYKVDIKIDAGAGSISLH